MKKLLFVLMVLASAVYAQGVVIDTVIMSTAGAPGPGDRLYKLDGNSLDTLATHATGYFDTIANLSVLPNGNFGVIIKTGASSLSRVWLLHTDEFTGSGSTHYAGVRTITSGGSNGGMSNRQGEFFLDKIHSSISDGARVYGLDDTLPVIDNIDGGYFDSFIKGTALSNGNWVLGGDRGDGLGSIEVRRSNLPGARLARLSGTDPIGAIGANSLDHIGVGTNGGDSSTIYSFHIDGSSLAGPSALHYGQENVTDIKSLSNGDWVVALYDARFDNGGRVVILHEDLLANTLTQIGSTGGFGRIGALAVQTDDDIVIGAHTPGLPWDTLHRYNSSLVEQAQIYGFDPITNLAVIVPEPATMILLGLGLGGLLLRRRK